MMVLLYFHHPLIQISFLLDPLSFFSYLHPMICLRFNFSQSIAALNIRSCRRGFSNINYNHGAVGRLLHHEWIIDGKIIPQSASAREGSNNNLSYHDNRRTVIFLHGLLGSGKVCYMLQF